MSGWGWKPKPQLETRLLVTNAGGNIIGGTLVWIRINTGMPRVVTCS